jgi:hypothetical protein
MTEIITGLDDEHITTAWPRERASDVGADDDATDVGEGDPVDQSDRDTGTEDDDAVDTSDGDADQTDA